MVQKTIKVRHYVTENPRDVMRLFDLAPMTVVLLSKTCFSEPQWPERYSRQPPRVEFIDAFAKTAAYSNNQSINSAALKHKKLKVQALL